MISTKNLISNISEVNRQWIFEYYLNLSEKLIGQDIKMLSVFNPKDKVPSMFIYFDTASGYYKFKDFSSGNQGDSIELVQKLFDLKTRGQAISKIISDYESYIENNNIKNSKIEFKQHDKFKVTDFQIRHWNNFDEKYWTDYQIGSTMLNKYEVYPLEHFSMSKEELDGRVNTIKFSRPFVYGYFRESGDLYKIYMPKNLEKKFIKVQNYTQGSDQLKYDCKYLIITSSLKDLMVFNQLGIKNIEAIAPDSENTMINEVKMTKFKDKYEKIVVLFDFDDAGKIAAEKYKAKHNLDYISLPLEKDLSDSVKVHGLIKVRALLFNTLKEILKR